MEEKKNKKLKVLIIVGIVLVLVSGVTIAYFMSRRTGTPTTVEAKDLAITYTGESKFNIDSKIDPIMESEILTSAPKVEFTVENTGEDNVYLQFDIVDITLNKFKDYDFKWALYQEDGKISTGSFIAEEDGKVTLKVGEVLTPEVPTTYQVYVWINETGNDQSDMMGGTFTGTVQVTGYGKDNTLAGKILSETINSNPIFSQTSTDRGLFVQQGDSTKSDFGFPTYYYRGSTTNENINSTYTMNNYVSFGINKTSEIGTKGNPIIWRVVRINEDGSIRLISSAFYSGPYFYELTSSLYDGSEIESTVNTWYNNNIGSNSGTTLDNLVQTGNFCNDISGNYNAVKTRIANNNPIFTCPNDGVMINSKVGLITADEMMYSGTLYRELVNNNLSYIIEYGKKDYPTWTMSPSFADSLFVYGESEFYVNSYDDYSFNNYLTLNGASDTFMNSMLIINLKPDVTIKSGDGTSTSPYIIG